MKDLKQAKVIVIGASGFVGKAVCEALLRRGANVHRLSAPRMNAQEATEAARRQAIETITAEIRTTGACAVVNCAGVSDSTSNEPGVLEGANSILPGAIAAAARDAEVRLVHTSSAAVQGRTPILNDSVATKAFSPYSHSKAAGEKEVIREGGREFTIYRPPGVHSHDRTVTQTVAKLARSRMSILPTGQIYNAPQALVENVGDAIAFLALCEASPPNIVIHPSEGLSTEELLIALGGRSPRRAPRLLLRFLLGTAAIFGQMAPTISANARRLEVMWFGQLQDESWLTAAGWQPVLGLDSWHDLGARLRLDDAETLRDRHRD